MCAWGLRLRFGAHRNDVAIPCLPIFLWTLNLGLQHLTVILEPWAFFFLRYFLENTEIYGNFLDNADIYGNLLENTDFYGDFLENTNIYGKFLLNTDLYGNVLENADIYGNFLENTDVYGNRMSCRGLVGIATRLQAGHSCVRTPVGVKDLFSSPKHPDLVLDPHPCYYMGTRVVSLR